MKVQLHANFIGRTLKFTTGGRLLEVVAWAGLTGYNIPCIT